MTGRDNLCCSSIYGLVFPIYRKKEKMLTKDSTVSMRNGSQIPLLGFGTYLCSTEEAEHGVSIALAAGYRHIDTAEFYNNHEGIAAAISKSGLKREEIFLTDKISPGGIFGQPERTFAETRDLVMHNLKRLNTTYFDLFLIHHAFAKEERLNQYRALLELQKEGYVREVGVSNWNVNHIEEIIAAGLPLPSANQIEIHPLCTQSTLIQYLQTHNILPIAYSSLAPLGTWRTAEGQLSAKTDSHSVPNTLPVSMQYAFSEFEI